MFEQLRPKFVLFFSLLLLQSVGLHAQQTQLPEITTDIVDILNDHYGKWWLMGKKFTEYETMTSEEYKAYLRADLSENDPRYKKVLISHCPELIENKKLSNAFCIRTKKIGKCTLVSFSSLIFEKANNTYEIYVSLPKQCDNQTNTIKIERIYRVEPTKEVQVWPRA